MPEVTLPTETTIAALLAAGAVDVAEHNVNTNTPDYLTAVVPTGYRIETADLSRFDRLREAPRRIHGTAVVTDTVSWLAYFSKYGDENSEVFGDVRSSTVTALLNAPDDLTSPAWGDHRVVLELEHSPAWLAWTGISGRLISQEAFAEHVEDRSPDVVKPDAGTMLELAQTLKANTGVKFESGTRLHDGQRRFTYAESIEAKAGQRGEIDIPTELKLRLPVWRGVGIVVEPTARFRYRIGRDGLALGIVLDRLDDVLDAAWRSLLGELTETLPVPVLAGLAPDYAASGR